LFLLIPTDECVEHENPDLSVPVSQEGKQHQDVSVR
jgi:hypothetical protein